MAMKNPPHPGGLVLRQCIEPLGLTIAGAAAALGVTRTKLSELVNEKRGISPENGLSKAFGGSAESWLTQQALMILRGSAPTASSSGGWHWFSQFQGCSFAEGSFPSAVQRSYKVKRKSLWLGHENLG